MARALWHAERGRGATTPNPVVGAVIVERRRCRCRRRASPGGRRTTCRGRGLAGRRGARGWVRRCTARSSPAATPGGPGRVASPWPRQAFAAWSWRRVTRFPQVSGRGFAYLRERGIEVTTGVGRRDARRQNAPFFRAVELGRPWVQLKVAMSLDGAVAARRGAAHDDQRPRGGTLDATAAWLRGRDRHRRGDGAHRRPAPDGPRRVPASPIAARGVRPARVAVALVPARREPRCGTGHRDGRWLARRQRRGGRLRDRGVEVLATDGTIAGALARPGDARACTPSSSRAGRRCRPRAGRPASSIVSASSSATARSGPDAVRWDVPAWLNGWAPRTVPLGHDVLMEADVYGTD